MLKLALEVVEVDRLGNAAFGNPTRTTGRFRECFAGGRFAHRWSPKQIDSRSVAMTNKAQIAAWVKDHGEDSDFICVRVRGVFPRTGSLQFIDSERVDEAVARLLVEDPTAPLIMGVDIARQGADQSVIRFRRGLDARSIPAVEFRIPDPMQIASRIMEQVNSYNPDAMFVDGTGIGWGVHDRLNLRGPPQSGHLCPPDSPSQIDDTRSYIATDLPIVCGLHRSGTLVFRTSRSIGIFDPARTVEAVRSGSCLGSEERPSGRLHRDFNANFSGRDLLFAPARARRVGACRTRIGGDHYCRQRQADRVLAGR